MSITRIIPSIETRDLARTRAFYVDFFGLQVDVQEEDFLMLSSKSEPSAQLVVNDNGHRGLPPGFAIDVNDANRVTELYQQLSSRGYAVVEPLTDKPWGIRRFSIIDPNGVRVTIISHSKKGETGE